MEPLKHMSCLSQKRMFCPNKKNIIEDTQEILQSLSTALPQNKKERWGTNNKTNIIHETTDEQTTQQAFYINL